VSRGGYRGPYAPHVRLFVQNEGPPKCLYRYDGPPHEGANPTFMSPNQLKWFRHAGRWWLVECESAEAGRHIIATHERIEDARRAALGGPVVLTEPIVIKGHILASGGARG